LFQQFMCWKSCFNMMVNESTNDHLQQNSCREGSVLSNILWPINGNANDIVWNFGSQVPVKYWYFVHLTVKEETNIIINTNKTLQMYPLCKFCHNEREHPLQPCLNSDPDSLTECNYEQFRWYLPLIINLTKLMKLITCSYFRLSTNIPYES
jgi:hypothetical protein